MNRNWVFAAVFLILGATWFFLHSATQVETVTPAVHEDVADTAGVTDSTTDSAKNATGLDEPTPQASTEGSAPPTTSTDSSYTDLNKPQIGVYDSLSSPETVMDELKDISQRIAQDGIGPSDDDDSPSEAQTDLIQLQSELMLKATGSREGAGLATKVLAECGENSEMVSAVRVVCASNLKRLSLQYPDIAEGRFRELSSRLSPDELQALDEVIRH